MSLKFRDANGVEIPVAGLNGTSGELIPSVSYYQTGFLNFSNLTDAFADVTILNIENQSVQYRVAFSTPMPDTDYVVVVDVHNTNLQVEVASADKTVNGFIVTVRNLVATMRADRGETTDGFTYALGDNYFNWSAFKLMTDESRALDEAEIADLSDRVETLETLTSDVIPSGASASNQLVAQNATARLLNATYQGAGMSQRVVKLTLPSSVCGKFHVVCETGGQTSLRDFIIQTTTRTPFVNVYNLGLRTDYIVKKANGNEIYINIPTSDGSVLIFQEDTTSDGYGNIYTVIVTTTTVNDEAFINAETVTPVNLHPTSTVASGSTAPITSGGVYSELNKKVEKETYWVWDNQTTFTIDLEDISNQRIGNRWSVLLSVLSTVSDSHSPKTHLFSIGIIATASSPVSIISVGGDGGFSASVSGWTVTITCPEPYNNAKLFF